MFKNTFQSGFLSILYSIGSKPLQIWDKKVSLQVASLLRFFYEGTFKFIMDFSSVLSD